MSKITAPMLSASLSDMIKKNVAVKYPLLGSQKLDGIRALVHDGILVSRKFKNIPNHYLRNKFSSLPEGIDGELLWHDLGAEYVLPEDEGRNIFQKTSSRVMSEDGEPKDIFYEIFDYVKDDIAKPYQDRMKDLEEIAKTLDMERIHLVLPRTISNKEEMDIFEAEAIADGFEGIMLRTPTGPYKCGRATPKEQYLFKVKQFVDAEAKITGFEEGDKNLNEKVKDALGHSKRSSAKDGKIPSGSLGKIIAEDLKTGQQIVVGSGTGLTLALRQEIWNNQDKYLGKIIVYKYQPYGTDESPRFPGFKGFRHEDDLSE